MVAKHYPTSIDETFKFKLALKLKIRRKHGKLVPFIVLEMLEDGNDGFKRGKTDNVAPMLDDQSLASFVRHQTFVHFDTVIYVSRDLSSTLS